MAVSPASAGKAPTTVEKASSDDRPSGFSAFYDSLAAEDGKADVPAEAEKQPGASAEESAEAAEPDSKQSKAGAEPSAADVDVSLQDAKTTGPAEDGKTGIVDDTRRLDSHSEKSTANVAAASDRVRNGSGATGGSGEQPGKVNRQVSDANLQPGDAARSVSRALNAVETSDLVSSGRTQQIDAHANSLQAGGTPNPGFGSAMAADAAGQFKTAEKNSGNLVVGTGQLRGQTVRESNLTSLSASELQDRVSTQNTASVASTRSFEANGAATVALGNERAAIAQQPPGQALTETGSFSTDELGDSDFPIHARDSVASGVLRSETVLAAISTSASDFGMARADSVRNAAANAVDVLIRQPGKPVEISLNPEELGRVRMALSTSETGVTVVISSERAETLDLMRRHIDQLAQEFQRLGYENTSFEFSQESGTDAGPFGDTPSDSLLEGNESPTEIHMSSTRLVSTGLDLRL